MADTRDVIRFSSGVEFDYVVDFFDSIDEDFLPPLSEREIGLEDRLLKSSEDGKIAVVERDAEIIAASAYWYDIDGKTLIIDVSGVNSGSRKSRVAYRLIEFMVKQEPDNGIERVEVETWSENKDSRALLEHLSFTLQPDIIENDMNSDRITVFYQADMKNLRKYFDTSRVR